MMTFTDALRMDREMEKCANAPEKMGPKTRRIFEAKRTHKCEEFERMTAEQLQDNRAFFVSQAEYYRRTAEGCPQEKRTVGGKEVFRSSRTGMQYFRLDQSEAAIDLIDFCLALLKATDDVVESLR